MFQAGGGLGTGTQAGLMQVCEEVVGALPEETKALAF